MAVRYDVLLSCERALPQGKDGGKVFFCALSRLTSVAGSALEPAWGGYSRLDNIGQYHIVQYETGLDAGVICVGPVFFALCGNAYRPYSGSSRKACRDMDWRCAA